MTEPLQSVIERALHADGGALERAVFGSDDAHAIAATLARFCRAELGALPRAALFYEASVGCVLGLELDDGRRVVLKTHQPDRSVARLRACQAAQAGLYARGFPCPEPLLDPRPLGRSLCTVEGYLERGQRAGPHAPDVRHEIAVRLHELVAIARAAGLGTDLGGSWFGALPPAQLWPRPHDPRLDFAATAPGAEWIDALAQRARAVPLAGDRVLGHFDWRVEHFRFASGRICSVYDWDSLHFEREPIAAGAAASTFTADFSRSDVPLAPTLDEMRAFLTAYESARGRAFDPTERRTAFASAVYLLAYLARCQHARGAREHAFIDRLREAGEALLDRR
jgi:hypothetical protein